MSSLASSSPRVKSETPAPTGTQTPVPAPAPADAAETLRRRRYDLVRESAMYAAAREILDGAESLLSLAREFVATYDDDEAATMFAAAGCDKPGDRRGEDLDSNAQWSEFVHQDVNGLAYTLGLVADSLGCYVQSSAQQERMEKRMEKWGEELKVADGDDEDKEGGDDEGEADAPVVVGVA